MIFGWTARQTIGRGGGDASGLALRRGRGDGAAECCYLYELFFIIIIFFFFKVRGFALTADEARPGPTRYGGHNNDGAVGSYLPLPLPPSRTSCITQGTFHNV